MNRFILVCFGLIMLMAAKAPDNRTIIIEQFDRSQGDWEGYMEYTDFTDNKTKYTLPAKCTTKFDGKKWEYEVQYDEGNGETVGGGGAFVLNDDGSKLDNNGVAWTITEVTQSGDSARIRMETNGKDHRKKAILRQTLDVTSTTFSILEEVKYVDAEAYFVRNKHIFRKKKK